MNTKQNHEEEKAFLLQILPPANSAKDATRFLKRQDIEKAMADAGQPMAGEWLNGMLKECYTFDTIDAQVIYFIK